MRLFNSLSLTRTQLALLTALWISLLPNAATLIKFYTSPSVTSESARWLFVFSGWLLVLAFVFGFIALIGGLFRGRSLKIWLSVCLIIAAALGYYSWFLGVQFDKTMLINTLETHPGEALELVGWRNVLWLFCVGVAPALFIWRCVTLRPTHWLRGALASWGLRLGLAAIVAALIYAQFQTYASAGRNRSITFHTVAPVNIVAAGASLAYDYRNRNRVIEVIGQDAVRSAQAKPRLVVFVLGETARAQNQQLEGYSRATNPRMLENQAVYFASTESCGTATAFSVPCMFSGLSREAFSVNAAAGRQNVLDILLRTGVNITWLDNDGGCKGVCARVETIDLTASINAAHCPERGVCYDSLLLDGLENRFKNIKQDTLIVLHLKGSHGPAYFKRYPKPFEKFAPACQANELTACSAEHLRNAYDNTLVYTDHILGEVTNMLKKVNDASAAMFYVSDHGESLGENGVFLHGLPYAIAPLEQTRVPMLAWFTPSFVSNEKWQSSCPAAQAGKGKKHEHVYHTLLGLYGVKTQVYKTEFDLFAACR